MNDLHTFFPSVGHFIATCGVVVVAEAVYVLMGFGSGLIMVGGLALILPEVQDVVVLLLLVNLPAELYVVFTARNRITWRGVASICAGIVVGVPIGTWVLGRGEPTVVLLALAVFLVVAGLAFLLFERQMQVSVPDWVAPPVGLLAGVLGGLFGTGGPPLIFYYQLRQTPKAQFRGNLMAIFLLVALIRLVTYAASGLITPVRLMSSAVVLPAVLVGAIIGHRLHVQLPEQRFRRLVSVILIVIGGVVALRYLR